MKLNIGIIILLAPPLLLANRCSTGEVSAEEQKTIISAVSATADSMMNAWAEKDRETFLSYHSDGFTFVIEGNLMQAKEAKKLLPGVFSRNDPFTVDFSWQKSVTSVLVHDMALYYGEFRILKTDTLGQQTRETGAMSIIFKRMGAAWKADHIHESIPNN